MVLPMSLKALHRFRTRLPIAAFLCACGWAASVLAQQPKTDDQQELLRVLGSDDPRLVVQAAAALQKATPKAREELVSAAHAVKSALGSTRDAAAERALRLALGTLAAAGVEDAAEWGFESMSVTHSAKTPPEVFEAHVRALEMVPGAAKELMIGNLDVALNLPITEPKERQRLKEFVTLTAEGMRTRELAVFLDALLTGEEGLFVKLEAPIEIRLLACYKLVKADPPIKADAVAEWLEKNPGGPVEVELAALETLSLVGTTKPDAITKLANHLVEKPLTALLLAKSLRAGRLDRALLPQVAAALRRHAAQDSTGELAKLLSDLERQK
jgi:hypothetical protein